MQKRIFYFVVFLLLGQSVPVFPQPGVSATGTVQKEKELFLRKFSMVARDSAILYPIARHFESGVDNIYNSINNDDKLPALEKEKAIRSLVYFIKELEKNIMRPDPSLYDIPGNLHAYRDLLTALLMHKPFLRIMEPLGPRQSQVMAASFSQYKEHSLIDDIAVYKRVASSPEYILQFLESRPNFRFADSLLLEAAAYDPAKIIFYLNRDKKGVQDMIRNNSNIYLQQISSLSGEKNALELLPFLAPIAESRLSTPDILEKRTVALSYFQLLVNTLQESVEKGETSIIFRKPLRRGLRQKAQSFYVNPINDLHNASDAVRFASVKDLRAQDLYYIITSSGEDLYTSSYLGLYKRLMAQFPGQYADSLFDIVHYDDLRVFIRLAANYNVIGDLLQHMSPERTKEILRRFISGIESDENTALERTMDIADSFTGVGADSVIREMMKSELQLNLDRCINSHNYLGVRLYTILSGMLEMTGQQDGMKKLWATLGDYELLKNASLTNEKGEIVELVLFYGDEDGVASFSNFLRSYTDTRKWEITKKENWISIRSVAGKPIIVYANRPLDIKQELDLQAQDSLFAYLKEQSLEPTVLVHRGHSYHLDKTLNRLTPSVKLAILGSCGSYNRGISIASINSDVQVIGSKKTGSKSINDPIIDLINETLLSDKDLYWPEIWKTLAKRFSKDEVALSMFNEYFPPSTNLGLFVLKLFNHYRRLA
ncbi:MAG TPA: hypothetical protein VMZ03_11105 [Chitinophagaceae bacterium]|nr:hypothetical protein [Chitinophagaceae bacterium]